MRYLSTLDAMWLQSRRLGSNAGRDSKRMSANLCYCPEIYVRSVRKFALCTRELTSEITKSKRLS
jgi:hypothetical protein